MSILGSYTLPVATDIVETELENYRRWGKIGNYDILTVLEALMVLDDNGKLDLGRDEPESEAQTMPVPDPFSAA